MGSALSWSVSWPWLATAILLTVFSYPVLEGLYAGQLGLLVGFLLAASLLALQRGRLFLAGILMALTTIKPQMTALAIFYLLLWSLADWGDAAASAWVCSRQCSPWWRRPRSFGHLDLS